MKIADNTQMDEDRLEDECLSDVLAEADEERDRRVWKRLDRGCWYRERLSGAE